MPRTEYSVPCPRCHQPMIVRSERTLDGWHDEAICCGHVWDVCCAEEFKRIDWSVPEPIKTAWYTWQAEVVR